MTRTDRKFINALTHVDLPQPDRVKTAVSATVCRRTRPQGLSLAAALCALLFMGTARAQTVNAQETADQGLSVAVLPGVFYSQETSLGFAVFGSLTFPLEGTSDGTWPSSVNAAVVYTLENQASLAVWPNVYLGAANDWAFEGEYIIEHFPNQYFGIGPEADDGFQTYTRNRLSLRTRVLHHLGHNIYLGGISRFALTGVEDISSAPWVGADVLSSGSVAGDDGSLVNGLGLVTRWDTRDNVQSTREGGLVELEVLGHPSWLGSDHEFAQIRLDSRAYIPFGEDGTFAVQWLNEVRTGDVPFNLMAELGGDNVLRGLYQGRFRDHNLTALQLEVRYPLVWVLRVVGFASLGQVFHDLADLTATAPKWSAGGGLRLELDEQTHTAIRLDVGGGVDGFGFVFTFGEAF